MSGLVVRAVDLNADGLVDFCSSNGHVVHHPRNAPLKQKPLVMLQSEENEYQECKPGGSDYFSTAHRGRGLATGDVNRDGRWDLLFTHLSEPAALLLNTTETSAKSLSIRLIGTRSDRRGTGGRGHFTGRWNSDICKRLRGEEVISLQTLPSCYFMSKSSSPYFARSGLAIGSNRPVGV